MNKKYFAELDQIFATEEFKDQLKANMIIAQKKSHFQTILKLAFSLTMCFVLGFTSFFIYRSLQSENEIIDPTPSITEEETLPILKMWNQQPGGIGSVGSLGNDPTLLAHNNPYTIKDKDKLPVFKNTLNEKSNDLSTYSESELLSLLENTAQKLGISNYTVVHPSQTSNSYMNSTLYLDTEYGTINVVSNNLCSLTLSDNINYYLGGTTQEEVINNVERLIEETSFINFKDPLIDVYVDIHLEGSNPWSIRISENKKDEVDSLVENQLNYIKLSLDQIGNLSYINYSMVDTTQKIGNYPIKSLEEAKEDLLSSETIQIPVTEEAIQYVEIVYDLLETNEYYLPYYKFYIIKEDTYGSILIPIYVNAIDDQYIEREGQAPTYML